MHYFLIMYVPVVIHNSYISGGNYFLMSPT